MLIPRMMYTPTPLMYALENNTLDKVRALLANENTKLEDWMAVTMVRNVNSHERIECIKLLFADERCTNKIVNHRIRGHAGSYVYGITIVDGGRRRPCRHCENSCEKCLYQLQEYR